MSAVNETTLKEALEKKLPSMISNYKATRARRIFADIPGEMAHQAVEYLKNEQGFNHLCTITGLDSGPNYEILYHLAADGTIFTLRAIIPAAAPNIATITDLFQGAESYERELEDMFGMKVLGLKPGNRYPLPDNWPPNQHPLLKSWKPDQLYPQEENKCQK